MARALIDDILLFLVPFGLFAVWLVLRQRSPLRWIHWSDHAARLAIAGAALVILSFLAVALTAERHRDGFVPTHIENGRVVPGQFR
ncbi:hypothetical protein DA075_01125 [Methylobacterium currus]|uniref:Uncharacterized protein n=1 Tax=Methylobacterium currus TaxID=2051553 RepID=A0A2R4WDS5_9HYPH|nr:DUF6111 family protein [Methylobacterium currus]AWB19706.1 hypothetical protein DA075_01125 [Methylobacterium currus]UHC15585.1 DUF6111 family protein [Methylobacterium currus]